MGYTTPMTNTDNAAGKANLTEVNDQNFVDFVSSGFSIIDLWAEWCQPCHAMSPLFEDLSNDYVGKVKSGKLDTDSNPLTFGKLVSQLGIMGIPTFVIFQDGQVVGQAVGVMPKARLKAELDKVLN